MGYAQQPGGYGQTPAPYGSQGSPEPEYAAAPTQKGFFRGLFDLSFSTFITTSIVKVIYVLFLVLAVLAGLFMAGSGLVGAIAGMSQGEIGPILMGGVMIVLSPLVAFLYIVLARVYMELVIVIFRIAENIAELNHKTPRR
jgi:hypothetical protein